MHLLKSQTLFAALGNIALYLITGVIFALGTEHNVPFLAAFSYLAALAELVAVGGHGAAAAAGNVFRVKFSFTAGVFVSEEFPHRVVVSLGSDKDGTFIAHYSAAGNCFHIYSILSFIP